MADWITNYRSSCVARQLISTGQKIDRSITPLRLATPASGNSQNKVQVAIQPTTSSNELTKKILEVIQSPEAPKSNPSPLKIQPPQETMQKVANLVQSLNEIANQAPQLSTNTHDYDGRLGGRVIELGLFTDLTKFQEEMLTFGNILFVNHPEGNWLNYFKMIVDDAKNNPQANIDGTNGTDAAVLLYNIWLRTKAYLDLTVLQLEDIASGTCQQGRATRLLSVLLALTD